MSTSAERSLSSSLFTAAAPGYAGNPMLPSTAASLVFTFIPPNGVTIFTSLLSPCRFSSTRHPAISIAATPSAASAANRLRAILRQRPPQGLRPLLHRTALGRLLGPRAPLRSPHATHYAGCPTSRGPRPACWLG